MQHANRQSAHDILGKKTESTLASLFLCVNTKIFATFPRSVNARQRERGCCLAPPHKSPARALQRERKKEREKKESNNIGHLRTDVVDVRSLGSLRFIARRRPIPPNTASYSLYNPPNFWSSSRRTTHTADSSRVRSSLYIVNTSSYPKRTALTFSQRRFDDDDNVPLSSSISFFFKKKPSNNPITCRRRSSFPLSG